MAPLVYLKVIEVNISIIHRKYNLFLDVDSGAIDLTLINYNL